MTDIVTHSVPSEVFDQYYFTETQYREKYNCSLRNPKGFWAEQAEKFITWFKR